MLYTDYEQRQIFSNREQARASSWGKAIEALQRTIGNVNMNWNEGMDIEVFYKPISHETIVRAYERYMEDRHKVYSIKLKELPRPKRDNDVLNH